MICYTRRTLLVAAASLLTLGWPEAASAAESGLTIPDPGGVSDQYDDYEGAYRTNDGADLPAVEYSSEVYAPFESNDGAPCSSCGGGAGGYFNRCGCNPMLFPWIRGPGNCDQWCVGPHWAVEVDGIFLFREANDWAPFTAAVGVGPDFLDEFDHAPGARVFATGYNETGYGMQVGYEGVNHFAAAAGYDLGGGSSRTFGYESNYNSVEINFIPVTPTTWRLFGGVRYMEIDENLNDLTTVAKPVPPPADPPTSTAFVDTETARLLDNRLIGFQFGAFRDAWRMNRWLSFEAFANSGVYCNNLRFRTVDTTVTTVYNSDDISTPGNEFTQTTSVVATGSTRNVTEIAFAGEAGLSGVLRLNNCVAVRGGYQVLVVNGVQSASDAYFSPAFNSDTLVYHGLQFGVEYRR